VRLTLYEGRTDGSLENGQREFKIDAAYYWGKLSIDVCDGRVFREFDLDFRDTQKLLEALGFKGKTEETVLLLLKKEFGTRDGFEKFQFLCKKLKLSQQDNYLSGSDRDDIDRESKRLENDVDFQKMLKDFQVQRSATLVGDTVLSLQKNGFVVIRAGSKDEVVPIISKLLNKGDRVGKGGSVTLDECGVVEFLKNGDYEFLSDASQAQSADVYFSSTNAITRDGGLYNVDGHSNRVSAIAFGPKKVIIVSGINKCVETLSDAEHRVQTIASPLNCKRLSRKTYCYEHGMCEDIGKDPFKNKKGCDSPERICKNYLTTKKQTIEGRITIILVNESLGY
jgi:hypothetical protein